MKRVGNYEGAANSVDDLEAPDAKDILDSLIGAMEGNLEYLEYEEEGILAQLLLGKPCARDGQLPGEIDNEELRAIAVEIAAIFATMRAEIDLVVKRVLPQVTPAIEAVAGELQEIIASKKLQLMKCVQDARATVISDFSLDLPVSAEHSSYEKFGPNVFRLIKEILGKEESHELIYQDLLDVHSSGKILDIHGIGNGTIRNIEALLAKLGFLQPEDFLVLAHVSRDLSEKNVFDLPMTIGDLREQLESGKLEKDSRLTKKNIQRLEQLIAWADKL